MLGVKNYSKEYVDACKANIDQQLKTYTKLASEAKNADSKTIVAFEHSFFNNLVVLLDAFFVHRIRAVEGKDGNPMNEVRVVANSVLSNKGKMGTDSTIKMKPENSVLKLKAGDEIRLSQQQFVMLSKAFFAEMEKRYL